MMMPPLIPPPPLRPGASPKERLSHNRAMAHYRLARRSRRDMQRWNDAMFIVMGAIMLLALAAGLLVSFGLNALLGVILVCGALFLLTAEVKKRLP